MTTREAHTTWKGGLARGKGTTNASSSYQFRDLAISWPSRIQEDQTETSPEELIASAHASCFAMAFAGELEKQGHAPEQLDVRARVSFGQRGDEWALTGVELQVEGRVQGMDEATFRQAANRAKDGCPVSRALAGNVPISLSCSLQGAAPA